MWWWSRLSLAHTCSHFLLSMAVFMRQIYNTLYQLFRLKESCHNGQYFHNKTNSVHLTLTWLRCCRAFFGHERNNSIGKTELLSHRNSHNNPWFSSYYDLFDKMWILVMVWSKFLATVTRNSYCFFDGNHGINLSVTFSYKLQNLGNICFWNPQINLFSHCQLLIFHRLQPKLVQHL